MRGRGSGGGGWDGGGEDLGGGGWEVGFDLGGGRGVPKVDMEVRGRGIWGSRGGSEGVCGVHKGDMRAPGGWDDLGVPEAFWGLPGGLQGGFGGPGGWLGISGVFGGGSQEVFRGALGVSGDSLGSQRGFGGGGGSIRGVGGSNDGGGGSHWGGCAVKGGWSHFGGGGGSLTSLGGLEGDGFAGGAVPPPVEDQHPQLITAPGPQPPQQRPPRVPPHCQSHGGKWGGVFSRALGDLGGVGGGLTATALPHPSQTPIQHLGMWGGGPQNDGLSEPPSK